MRDAEAKSNDMGRELRRLTDENEQLRADMARARRAIGADANSRAALYHAIIDALIALANDTPHASVNLEYLQYIRPGEHMLRQLLATP